MATAKARGSDGVGRNYVIRIFTVRGLYEIERLFAQIKVSKARQGHCHRGVDRATDVHRCAILHLAILWRQGRHGGICRRTADILVGLFIQE